MGALLELNGDFRTAGQGWPEPLHLISRVVELHLFQRDLGALEGHPYPFLVPQHLLPRGRCDSLQSELTSENGAVQPLPGRSQSRSAGAQTFENLDYFSRGVQGKASSESGGLLTILFSLALVRSLSKM